MGIKLDKAAVAATYERAIADARHPRTSIDETWAGRIRWLSEQIAGDAKGRTYIAAIGGALLAKATDDRVDTLTQREQAGPRGYYLRGVAEAMQKQGRGRVHLGTASANPMNNSPFYRGDDRIERIQVAGYLKHVFDTYRDWLREADGYAQPRAYAALVAFVKVRMAAQQAEDAALAAGQQMTAAASAADLLEVVQLWMTEDPEEGGRGQAVATAALRLVWPGEVEVVPKNHPAPFDVRRTMTLACEVKQKVVGEDDVLELARRAGAAEYTLGLYAAFAIGQPPLAGDRLRRHALEQHGVLLDVVYDAHELLAHVAVYGGVDATVISAQLGQEIADACHQAGVSTTGLQRLANLLA